MNTTSSNQSPLNPEQSVALAADADTMARRYVRITGRSANGFVQFEYSVGWPDFALEMALPEALFNDFCLKNKVQFLTEPVGPTLGDNDE
ncbi:MAG: phenol hydroxylase subunit [Oxalobacteraceae bacterium]|jgi:phenol hydroxylase P0 protein|nr:phenol hydroxylase subunit [Oxalobacteraceae bacterium]